MANSPSHANPDKPVSRVQSFLRGLFSKSSESENRYVYDIHSDGVVLASKNELGPPAKEPELVLYQHALLQQLVEGGEAELVPGGFFCPNETILALSNDDIDLLALPQRLSAEIDVVFRGTTTRIGFSARASFILPDGDKIPVVKPYGAFVEIDGEDFCLNRGQHMALAAIFNHSELSPEDKGEDKNLELVALLQEASHEGAHLKLRHFDSLKVVRPDKPSVALTRNPDGSLDLTPIFGDGIHPDDIERRLGQIPTAKAKHSSLRVRDKIVFLTEERIKATQSILGRKHIPPEDVEDFLRTPSAFLNPDLVDLDTGFAVRVQGVTEFRKVPNADWQTSEYDWFGEVAKACSPEVLHHVLQTEDDVNEFERETKAAWSSGANEVVFGGQAVDISNHPAVEKAIEKVRDQVKLRHIPLNEDEVPEPPQKQATYVLDDVVANRTTLTEIASQAIHNAQTDFSRYKRTPFPHQKTGVQWMVGLSLAATGDTSSSSRITGALLADDMGLGKTYMALVGIDHFLREEKSKGRIEKPVLVVAPLSLLENWSREINDTFKESPFEDIVTLQSAKDLPRFKVEGATRETRQNISDDENENLGRIQYSLKVGSHYGQQKLDQPRRLVLASYETLRNYQFSLGRVDWSWVIFDEAQNVKNRNTLQSRAAAALKADFKLLATGTPVENRLADFWCIMDIAQPGLLGNWEQFRDTYVKPSEEDAVETGRKLHSDVGDFMLRRTKESTLEGIPEKIIHHGSIPSGMGDETSGSIGFSESLRAVMSQVQLNLYDQTLADLQVKKLAGSLGSDVLQALHRLRQISLHPMLAEQSHGRKPPLDQWAEEGCKVSLIGPLLDRISRQGEKVLIFVITKSLQRDLKVWLERRYGITIDIINGDTKAAGPNVSETRMGIIDRFQRKTGFNILIMSPIAAGIGLTITEANHVIHFERHWNPAKEAQATDRVYRIGQKKDVHVYLPIAAHPSVRSFDDTLDDLLRSKIILKDAVIAPHPVTEGELFNAL